MYIWFPYKNPNNAALSSKNQGATALGNIYSRSRIFKRKPRQNVWFIANATPEAIRDFFFLASPDAFVQ
jgi:hypothetical protein